MITSFEKSGVLRQVAASSVRRSAAILIFFLAIVGLFEFLPAVDQARAMFPADLSGGFDCHDVLRSRPWYGQINPWLWFWLISTPVVVFSTRPSTPVWQRAFRTIFIIAISYVVINLGTHLAMDIRNAPFHGDGIAHFNGVRITSEEDEFKFHCYDIADGAKYAFALLFGWLPALIYTGWWEIAWYQYHKRITKLIDAKFETDWISGAVIFIALAVPMFLAGWVAINR